MKPENNIGKNCLIGYCQDPYLIVSYSNKTEQYLLRASEVYDNQFYFGWVDTKRCRVLVG